MDTSEYMPMFLAEAREHLQELNLAIVRLEEAPEDRPIVDEIFRIAHSLKGMSATMGFAQVAALTHQMEEVLELLRQRTGELPRELVDTVLACLDALAGAVDTIEETGQDTLDPGPLVERLQQLVRSSDVEETDGHDVGEQFDPATIEAPAGATVLRIKATLAEEVLMPSVRALMVLTALADHGDLVHSVPDADAVEGFQGKEVVAWLVTHNEPADVEGTVRAVSDVASVQIGAAEAVPEPAAETPPQDAAAAPPQAAAGQQPVEAPTETKPSSHAARTVRVDAERLDLLMHSMGELVIHRTAVEALTAKVDVPGLQQAVQDLARSSQALQSMVMQVRMIPVEVVFLRFPRLVRDLSTKLGKEVELKLTGKETELDRTVVDALGDPLVHLVRNSLDHGLEPPEERAASGKPTAGTLEIAARHAGGSVVIEVSDDGRGIDPQAVARKAVSKGLIDEAAAAEIDMRGAVELLFGAGFSTAEQASDISGRGVGMDVVRTTIRALGGEVVLDSTPGRGTVAQIRLPLTLAIMSALQVTVSGAPFAIPLDRVERTLHVSGQMVRSLAGRRVLNLEDSVLPLLDGAEAFGRERSGAHELVVIVRGQDRRLGLVVDELVGQRELVTRPLPNVVSDGEPVSGGAVLADGRIALIVDCDALAMRVLSAPGAAAAPAAAPLPTKLAA